jgi:hypothetical protein
MKIVSSFTTLFFLCLQQNFAQQNCSTPLPVTLCPSTYLTSQTNAGMIDDLISTCNISGEDLVYRVSATLATQRIYVSFNSVSGMMRMSLQSGACGALACSYYTVWPGSSNFVWNVSGNTSYYLWIDASTTVTFNIGIGGDTSNTFISIPNTQGNLGFDMSVCATPAFKASKPCYQVKYNGVYQTDPMTLSPLNVTGSLCIIAFFKNTTGVEGIKQFDFYYNPSGFSSFAPNPSTLPGFYNAGTWVSSSSLGKWTFIFNDLAGTGKGDFTGTPNNCVRYEFCFDVIPVSNDPVLTNIKDTARSDGFGAPFNGTVRSGCCPSGYANCLGASGPSTATSGHAFGFGLADPGGLLPIVLLQFDAKPKNETVEVNWITQSELNNDYFTVEKSKNGHGWITAETMDGAGNSTSSIIYHYTDADPFFGTSYYRLKQTDFDGTESFSPVVAVKSFRTTILNIYPNPTKGNVVISGFNAVNNPEQRSEIKIIFSNLFGEKFNIHYTFQNNEIQADLSDFTKGIYLIEVDQEGEPAHGKIILE